MYSKKTSGTSLIELILVMGLIGIMMMLIHPTLKIFALSKDIMVRSAVFENKNSRSMDNIKNLIYSSSESEEVHCGRNYLKNGKGIFDYDESVGKVLDSSFFSNIKNNGNFLFLEIPMYKDGSVSTKYLGLKLANENFYLVQYSLVSGEFKQQREDVMISNVKGNIKMNDKLIELVIEYTDDQNNKKGSLKIAEGTEIIGRYNE